MEFKLFGEKALKFVINDIKDDARINILEGSVRSGKTVAMIPKLLKYLNEGPQGLIAIVGVSKETIYDNVLKDLFETVGEGNYKYNHQRGVLTLFGRNLKVIGAKDEGAEKYLRGKTLAGAFVDELVLIPQIFFEQLLNRMSVAGAKLYATTNPGSPFHWLREKYMLNEGLLKQGYIKIYHFELKDNPNLEEEYINFITNAYSGMFYKRFILGQWVLADGLVYDMFSSEKNIFQNTNKNYTEYYISCDYGIQNPMVFLLWGKCGKKWYCIKEYYHDGRKEPQKTDEESYNDLVKFAGNLKIKSVIIDPSASSFIVLIRKKNKFRIQKAKNDVFEGINRMAVALQNQTINYNECCTNTIKEFGTYIWDEKAVQRGEDKPVKENDHAMDASRYFVNTIIYGGGIKFA